MYRTNINGEIYLRTSISACLELEFSLQNYDLLMFYSQTGCFSRLRTAKTAYQVLPIWNIKIMYLVVSCVSPLYNTMPNASHINCERHFYNIAFI